MGYWRGLVCGQERVGKIINVDMILTWGLQASERKCWRGCGRGVRAGRMRGEGWGWGGRVTSFPQIGRGWGWVALRLA